MTAVIIAVNGKRPKLINSYIGNRFQNMLTMNDSHNTPKSKENQDAHKLEKLIVDEDNVKHKRDDDYDGVN